MATRQPDSWSWSIETDVDSFDVDSFVARFLRMDVVVCAEDTSRVLAGVVTAFNPCTVRGVALVGGLLWSCKECILPECILPAATRQSDS